MTNIYNLLTKAAPHHRAAGHAYAVILEQGMCHAETLKEARDFLVQLIGAFCAEQVLHNRIVTNKNGWHLVPYFVDEKCIKMAYIEVDAVTD